jgi:hypothetical protein
MCRRIPARKPRFTHLLTDKWMHRMHALTNANIALARPLLEQPAPSEFTYRVSLNSSRLAQVINKLFLTLARIKPLIITFPCYLLPDSVWSTKLSKLVNSLSVDRVSDLRACAEYDKSTICYRNGKVLLCLSASTDQTFSIWTKGV